MASMLLPAIAGGADVISGLLNTDPMASRKKRNLDLEYDISKTKLARGNQTYGQVQNELANPYDQVGMMYNAIIPYLNEIGKNMGQMTSPESGQFQGGMNANIIAMLSKGLLSNKQNLLGLATGMGV